VKEALVGLRRNHVVLVVDDEPTVLRLLERKLRDEPYCLLTTSQAGMAAGWLQACDVSLVIADQWMPELNGLELLRAVAETSPTTQRVLLTAAASGEVVLGSLADRIRMLMTKPWDAHDLRRRIRLLLRERELDLERRELNAEMARG